MIGLIRDGMRFVATNDVATVLREFNKRDAHPLLQFVKYGLCGVISVITQLIVAYSFAYTVIPAIEGMLVDGVPIAPEQRAWNFIYCNCIGFVFANIVAYYTNVIWVFEPGKHNRWLEFGMFTAVAFFAFLVSTFIAPLLIKHYNISSHVAMLLFVFTSAMVNYACRKFLIFKG